MNFNPWRSVSPGQHIPDVVNAIIEIPRSSRAKYELDKETGMLRLDRVLYSPVYYPANYGFVPQTYCDDDDPLDILVLSQTDIQPLCLVEAKIIGVMRMLDQGKADDKLIAVCANDTSVSYYNDIMDLPPLFTEELRQFFEVYKKLEHKEVIVEDFLNAEDGSVALDHEEFPRPSTTLEGLAGLKASFAALADVPLDDKGLTFRSLILKKYPDLKIEHIHHAGNSSGVVDGSAALLLASPDYATANGLKPRARVVAIANQGDCPTLMLNAPVPAARRVLAKAGLTLEDIDLFEINEAFAVVAEKFIRDLDLDREKVNVNGGAMALGHPIGATGSMLIGTMLDELERRGLQRGLITMCAGGGMAPAIIIERIH